jgi:hypothetical protein
MRRRPTLVERFRVEPPPSVQLFAELMRARGELRALVERRLEELRAGKVPTVSARQVADKARAVHGAREAWRKFHQKVVDR